MEQFYLVFPEFSNISRIKKTPYITLSPKIKLYLWNTRSNFPRHLFQLRVGLSKLRYHKKRHSFLDTPSDICVCNNGVEDCDHYFFHCPFYITHRANLRAKVSSILSRNDLVLNMSRNLLLYGHDSLPFQDNRDILLATLEFIVKSNRFDH